MDKDMHYLDCLTNEMLLKRFPSQFDLVRYAINRAEHNIEAGKDTFHGRNMASEILEDIAEGYDLEEDETEDAAA